MKNQIILTVLLACICVGADAQQYDSCNGVPMTGAIIPTQANECGPYTIFLKIPTGEVSAIYYQWQSSSDGTTFTNIPGATSNEYSPTILSSNIYFRDSAVCLASGISVISAPVEMTSTVTPYIVATLPYFQGFEHWFGDCFMFDRPDSSITLNPTSGGNSWRRNDQGYDECWDTAIAAYSPASTEGMHSARFNTLYAPHHDGNMYLHINLSNPGTKTIKFDFHGDPSSCMIVNLSEDNGKTFNVFASPNGLSDYCGPVDSGWSTKYITTNSVAANAIIDFDAVCEDEDIMGISTDIGIDNLSVTSDEEAVPIVNSQFGMDVYPNPVKNIVTAKIYGITSNSGQVTLTDIAGRVITKAGVTAGIADLNMRNLATGIYLLRYEDAANTKVIKVVKE